MACSSVTLRKSQNVINAETYFSFGTSLYDEKIVRWMTGDWDNPILYRMVEEYGRIGEYRETRKYCRTGEEYGKVNYYPRVSTRVIWEVQGTSHLQHMSLA